MMNKTISEMISETLENVGYDWEEIALPTCRTNSKQELSNLQLESDVQKQIHPKDESTRKIINIIICLNQIYTLNNLKNVTKVIKTLKDSRKTSGK